MKRPLENKRILVTREPKQAEETCRVLGDLGAIPIRMPTIMVAPPDDPGRLADAVNRLVDYDALVVTSVNAVSAIERAMKTGPDRVSVDRRPKVYAVGPATADALGGVGFHVDAIAGEHRAEGVLALFSDDDLTGKRILFPRAEQGRDVLPERLAERGAEVDLIPAYRLATPPPEQVAEGLAALKQGAVDAVLFASGSAARHLAEMVGGEQPLREVLADICVAVIGPVTRQTCLDLGLTVAVMPDQATLPALIQALSDHYRTP